MIAVNHGRTIMMTNQGYINQVGKENILIIDDDPDTCNILALMLKHKGYSTTTAMSGKEGLDYFGVVSPSLIILDVMMPEMDGWETYRRIRLQSKDIPVLFLTAIYSGDTAARALEIGAADWVRKPFHSGELLARVDLLLRTRKFASSQRPTVSVIIPTLNEAENLPYVLPYLPMDWIDEVVLVDGRSKDGTVEVAQQIMPSIKILLEHTPGKGIAMQNGYWTSKGDIISVIDADGSHDPREIPRFVRALMEGADFVKGSRFAPGGGTTDMPHYRQLGNLFFTKVVNILFGAHFTDLCYGFHAFWRYCLSQINLSNADGFEIDTALYLRALTKQVKIVEVPSFEGCRFYGKGKLRTFPDGWRVLRTIILEYERNIRAPCKDKYIGFRGIHPGGIYQAK
jgi:CheY-like chemotaxis protein